MRERAEIVDFASPLRAEHVGLFWSSIRSEFPTIQQQPMVATPLGGTTPVEIQIYSGVGEMFPLPRFWIDCWRGVVSVFGHAEFHPNRSVCWQPFLKAPYCA